MSYGYMMKTYFSRFDTKLYFPIRLLFNYFNLILCLGVNERLHNGIYHQFSFEKRNWENASHITDTWKWNL